MNRILISSCFVIFGINSIFASENLQTDTKIQIEQPKTNEPTNSGKTAVTSNVQNTITPTSVISTSITPTEQQNQNTSSLNIVDKISIQSSDIIKNLYPESAYEMFNKNLICDATKWNQDSINIYVKVTPELCNAILDKNTDEAIKLIMTSEQNKAPALREVIVYYLKGMINNNYV